MTGYGNLKRVVFIMFALMGVFSSAAMANQWGPGPQHIHQFHERDIHVWRGGSWYHGVYGGRMGWYWTVGGAYYFYPRPIYPYPDPYVPGVVLAPIASNMAPPPPMPVAPVVQSQNLPSVWYFCEASKSYYPYAAECPTGWKAVPATPHQ